MSIVKAHFDSVDLAELASLRLKSELKTVRHVDFAPAAPPSPSDVLDPAAGTRFADYYNVPVFYNEGKPSAPYQAKYGYFQPESSTATRVTVQLDESEAKSCLSLLRGVGGTKVSLVSD